jgi:hypothetical protein
LNFVNLYTAPTFSYTVLGKPSEQRFDKLNPPWFPGKKERFFSDNINSWDSDVPLALRAFPLPKTDPKKSRLPIPGAVLLLGGFSSQSPLFHRRERSNTSFAFFFFRSPVTPTPMASIIFSTAGITGRKYMRSCTLIPLLKLGEWMR